MPRELKNAQITHVSYVDKGANQKKFFITKSEENPDFQKEVKIVSKSDEQQLVYGIVYEPDVEDSHQDYMTAEEIEKAAHGFLKDARNIDTQHDFNAGVGEVVESYVAPADIEMSGETIKKGSWILVTKASDDIWEQIKKGDITGYSMAGTAEVIQKEDKPQSSSKGDEAGLFNLLKNFFVGSDQIKKGEVQEKYDRDRRRREFWAAQDALNTVIFNWDDWDRELEKDPEKIREALEDFVNIAQQVLLAEDLMKELGEPPEEIEKAGKKISNARMKKINAAFDALKDLKAEVESEEEEEVKKEDIAKAVEEAMKPLNDRLDAIEKNENKQADPAEDDIKKQIQDAVAASISPLSDRLDNIEKARGSSQQRQADPAPTEEVTKGYARLFQ
ncbi:XkdF-like putative serine protease domain-containing protein [Jeotgalibacillus malaysiensis]|uniref:XkdF-like putative serine protease domain-containing protein n=1 Tax=Jeotgalibacillus malaysiensis TaxID=1508404 RepID=UPI0038512356